MLGIFSSFSLSTAKSNENINVTHAKEEAKTITGHSRRKKISELAL